MQQQPLARCRPHRILREADAEIGRHHPEAADVDGVALLAAFDVRGIGGLHRIECRQRAIEAGDAEQRGAPVGDGGKVADVPAQRALHLVEGADDQHQLADGHVAGEIEGRGGKDRRHQCKPAVARRHPGEAHRGADDGAEDIDHASKGKGDAIGLRRLAVVQGDGVTRLVDANEFGAEGRLPRRALGIHLDQAAADAPAEPRGGGGIEQRAPHHEAGNLVAVPGQGNADVAGLVPQHADEGEQQQRRLEQADAEAAGEVRQGIDIRLQALVGVFADETGARQAVGAAGLHPGCEECADEAPAQRQLQRQVQPELADVERQQDDGEFGEDPELLQEARKILAGERIVEGLVPGVELDLVPGGGGNHHDEGRNQQQQAANRAIGAQQRHHVGQLRGEAWGGEAWGGGGATARRRLHCLSLDRGADMRKAPAASRGPEGWASIIRAA